MAFPTVHVDLTSTRGLKEESALSCPFLLEDHAGAGCA